MGSYILRVIRPGISAVLSICIIGCTTAETVRSAEELNSKEQTIRVHLLDQRVVNFWPEKYTVNQGNDSIYITGVGLETDPKRPGERKWEGSIARREIVHIDVVEKTTFAKIMIPVGLTIAGLFIATIVFFTIFPIEMH